MFPEIFALVVANATETKSLVWFFEQCDAFGKGITLLLVFCSVISIATMAQKFLELSSLRRRNMIFEQKLRGVESITGINILRGMAELCPYEYLAAEAGSAYQRHRGKVLDHAGIALCMGHVENAIQRGMARQLFRYERKLILLTSLVSGGPFLGLLGTVYGVMIAFGGLSDKATISQLAPGVAGALITTTCGLLVAIPATFGYNYLLTQTKLMTTELENYASALADRIELELMEILRQADTESLPVARPLRGGNAGGSRTRAPEQAPAPRHEADRDWDAEETEETEPSPEDFRIGQDWEDR